MELDGEKEEVLAASTGSKADNLFDDIVGELQSLVMRQEFQDVRDTFLKEHCSIFEDTEENKLEYTPLFKEWTRRLEGFIETELAAAIPSFTLAGFIKMLGTRRDQIDEELFDMLASLGDFQAFKEEMIAYRSFNEGGDVMSGFLQLSPVPSPISATMRPGTKSPPGGADSRFSF